MSMHPQIDLIIDRIVKQFNPDKIILFGSYARGTAHKDSDVDLLVVLPVSGSKRDKVIEIRVALNEIDIAKDIFIATPEDIEAYKNVLGTLIHPAVQEGKVVYERAA